MALPAVILSRRQIWFIVSILCALNVVNYMDRITIIATQETYLKKSFCLTDRQLGWIQPAFIVPYMFTSFLAGYLGDRHNRKWVIVGGSVIWMLSIFSGSFVNSADIKIATGVTHATKLELLQKRFWIILASRMGLGVGDACLVTIAPSILHDLFLTDKRRLQLLTLFNIAIPIGAALGLAFGTIGPAYAQKSLNIHTDLWQWSLRSTAPLSLVLLAIYIFFMPNVPHGYASRLGTDALTESEKEDSEEPCIMAEPDKTVQEDPNLHQTIQRILKNTTFRNATLGSTCLWFCCGACTAWMLPLYIRADGMWQAQKMAKSAISSSNATDFCGPSFLAEPSDTSSLQLYFGGIVFLSGIVGPVGALVVASKWRTSGVESKVCAYSGAGAAVSLLFIFTLGELEKLMLLTALFALICLSMINVNFTLGTKVILEVVHPREKSVGMGVFMTVAHMFGDALSPVLIGALSTSLANTHPDMAMYNQFRALRYSMCLLVPVAILGAVFFWMSASTYRRDVYSPTVTEATGASSSDSNVTPLDGSTPALLPSTRKPDRDFL